MKRALFCLGFCMFVLPAVVVLGGLDDGLILYYTFDENNSHGVNDLSGNGFYGMVHGAIFTTAGKFNGAYHYDGVNDYILAGNLGPIAAGTISYWMYADAVEGYRNTFCETYATADRGLRMECGTGGWFYAGQTAIFTTSMQASNWYHVVYTWTPTNVVGYLNGAPAFTIVFAGHPDDTPTFQFPNVALGNGYSTAVNRYWKGMLDELRIYSRTVSADEALALYNHDYETPSTEEHYVATIGFSDDPEGDQDVTEFYTDETLYIRVRDVDFGTNGAGMQVRLKQGKKVPVVVDLALNPDGSFTGSTPLSRFKPGIVKVTLNGFDGRRVLYRQSEIVIHRNDP